MFDWILNMPLETYEKNKEKQAFLLIHANSSDSVKCKRKPMTKICLKSTTKTP